MANRNKNRKPYNEKANGKSQNRGNKKGNWQDKAMVQEKMKGFKEGRAMNVHPITTESSDNDASWYIPFGQMAKDVASLPETISSGYPVKTSNIKKTDMTDSSADPFVTSDVVKHTVVPGVLVYKLFHTVGNANDAGSPINVAANSLYQSIQTANSRTPSYEASDMMLYFVALSELLSAYMWAIRVYGAARRFSLMNRYEPEALLKAMNVDWKDINGHMAEFRTALNQIAAAMASLYLPKGIDYVNRRIFLYQSIYTDADNSKAQYYMFNPVGFYKYVEGDSSHPKTYCLFSEMPIGPMKHIDITAYLWSLLEPLRASQDIRMIAADMIKAFGLGTMYQVNPIAETYTVDPVYNAEVLSQFENAYICPAGQNDLWGGSIEQVTDINTGYLSTSYTYVPYETEVPDQAWTEGSTIYNDLINPSTYLINFHKSDVSAEEILVATRLMTVPKLALMSTSKNYFSVQTDATEIVAGAVLYAYTADHELQNVVFCSDMVKASATGFSATQLDLITMALLSRFDWNPKLRISTMYAKRSSDGTVTQTINGSSGYMFDLDNYFEISPEMMDNMNYMALLGLFTPKQIQNAIKLS